MDMRHAGSAGGGPGRGVENEYDGQKKTRSVQSDRQIMRMETLSRIFFIKNKSG